MEPIGAFLRGNRLKLSELQDYVIDIIYDKYQSDALLYGGTAIWRCFGGTRFSEDIDMYLDKRSFDSFVSSLNKYGLRLIWQDPEFPTTVRISNNQAELLLETKEGYAENEIRAYSRIDGSTKTISVLSATELMVRKVEAYLGRRFIRDIYDLFVLTNWLDKRDYFIRTKLYRFLNEIPTPVDEQILSSLLYSGTSNLSFISMVTYIKRWLDEI
ncbi:MAG: nucleotidyl transferase AbiEii/AbiGii toxin family protein [Thermoplasmatales archaeon]|nr:nucleotidyl transferase AbiEii/AbiGii toxin family protein [Thermoplasmatales archaeon]MCW6170321.1 nucleotidyl transferase AbiEii/AbiGii toxin family protein [Thermoplasmatales archaeon]